MIPFTPPAEPSEKSLNEMGRRDFVKLSAAGFTGLVLSVNYGLAKEKVSTESFVPSVYLNITPEGVVQIIAHRSEMGQGIRSSLPMVIADELEADWQKVKIVQAIGDEKYGDQNTDGSYSVRRFYEPMREAGALARTLLEMAASQVWSVSLGECKAKNGEIIHLPTNKKLSFGMLVDRAAKIYKERGEEIKPKLKSPAQFKLIGKKIPIVDLKDIVTGRAIYGIDATVPDAKVAVVARCPVVGGRLLSYNKEEVRQLPGVVDIVEIKGAGIPPQINKPLGGVAVIAQNTWQAIKGRDTLAIHWDYGPNADYDSEKQQEDMIASLDKEPLVWRSHGEVEKSLPDADKVIETTFSVPYYAHATIEPPSVVAHVKDQECEIWAPTQHPQLARTSVANALGLEKEQVTINVTLLGGGFGRKSKPDFIVEAALIAKEVGIPIRLLWTREDDVQHDFYHAQSIQKIRVGLDKKKTVTSWDHHTVFPSISATSDASVKQPSAVEMGLGSVDLPFDIPSIRISSHESTAHTRIGWIRSVSNIHHAFAIGTMVDQIAEVRGMDPVENMLDLIGSDRNISFDDIKQGEFWNYNEGLKDYPWETSRFKNVVQLVAEKSKWGKKLPAGRGQGIFAHRSFLTYVACVVDVEVDANGNITMPEVHYGVDCGLVVNHDRVISQFEGGAVFASSFALTSKITMKDGRVQQGNFDTYQLPRMPQAPKKISVHLVDSKDKPTGVGEPPVPPFIPALCNAVYAATGKRISSLPIDLKG